MLWEFDTLGILFYKMYFILTWTWVHLEGGIPFSAVTFEVSFLGVIALLPVSVIYHLKAYVVNFQNSHIILIWLPFQRY